MEIDAPNLLHKPLQGLEFLELQEECKSRSDSASQKRLNYSVALPE